MDVAEKQLAISLIHAFENLLVENLALTRLTEIHRIPSHVVQTAVAVMRNDPAIAAIARARLQPIYDSVEQAPAVSTVVELLVAKLQ